LIADFETWAMRGTVAFLGGLLVRIGLQRVRTQDEREGAFREALEAHRKATEETFRDFRKEFLDHLDRIQNSSETSMRALNTTMAEIAGTAGEIRARMAERYATKEDLAALEERIKERFRTCADSCPPSCKE